MSNHTHHSVISQSVNNSGPVGVVHWMGDRSIQAVLLPVQCRAQAVDSGFNVWSCRWGAVIWSGRRGVPLLAEAGTPRCVCGCVNAGQSWLGGRGRGRSCDGARSCLLVRLFLAESGFGLELPFAAHEHHNDGEHGEDDASNNSGHYDDYRKTLWKKDS